MLDIKYLPVIWRFYAKMFSLLIVMDFFFFGYTSDHEVLRLNCVTVYRLDSNTLNTVTKSADFGFIPVNATT